MRTFLPLIKLFNSLSLKHNRREPFPDFLKPKLILPQQQYKPIHPETGQEEAPSAGRTCENRQDVFERNRPQHTRSRTG